MSNVDFNFNPNLPLVVTAAGAQPTPPTALLAQLIAAVSAQVPGYTANLPGSLIEDISSTDVGALVIIDSARVETTNSLTPLTANAYVLSQLGQIYIGPGSAPAVPTNTSVYVQFTAIDTLTSSPAPGLVIPRGFTVSDGTYQYVVQDGGVTASDGVTLPLFCQATIPGSWTVPSSSVSQIVTSAPTGIGLTCFNPEPGISGGPAETQEQYLARVLQAGMAIATGTSQLVKTLLAQVPGVQQRLISVVQQVGGGWEVICGGGDPYLTAGAINASGLDISTLVGSTLAITNITQTAPGVITTALNHGYATGQRATASGIVGMTELNAVTFTVTVINEKQFSIGIDTTGYLPYVSGGVLTPNPRNVTVNLSYPPDVYAVPFVNPPAQTVTMTVTYQTTAINFTSQGAVAQDTAPAIAAYVNAILVGGPISLLDLGTAFAEAWTQATGLDPSLISSLTFEIFINGVETSAVGQLILGDPESYMTATTAGITVLQAS
jgi:hypothetical protein